jgi:hypothetical protein
MAKPSFDYSRLYLYIFREKYILRFAVCSRFTVLSDITLAWQEVLDQVQSITMVKQVDTEKME